MDFVGRCKNLSATAGVVSGMYIHGWWRVYGMYGEYGVFAVEVDAGAYVAFQLPAIRACVPAVGNPPEIRTCGSCWAVGVPGAAFWKRRTAEN